MMKLFLILIKKYQTFVYCPSNRKKKVSMSFVFVLFFIIEYRPIVQSWWSYYTLSQWIYVVSNLFPRSNGIYMMVKTNSFVVYKWRDRRRDRVTSIAKQRHQMCVMKHRNLRREKKMLNYLRMSACQRVIWLHSLGILQRQTVELKCSY